ncbi:Polysaccharide pyruvyl transferase [Pseudomonas kuykendallii]|uniref:Polysaccharide pyruvyl transferase n=1 Tax=Pseudomonas kuykendallii TaxID=1007099 RepID=A0A1H2VYC6_9PSED|nr:Polysaccharide pyruvyl transferase [Pseudomonas kuykendallii]
MAAGYQENKECHVRPICLLEYTGAIFERFVNLGDDIQTLAVSRLVPRVDGYVSREALNQIAEPCTVPMNGFFMNTGNWPPSAQVSPVFFAFHISPPAQAVICSPEGIDYLRRWQPIGCRDRGTQALLERHGVQAYYSRCVTLTLPRREQSPEGEGEVFLVGLSPAARRTVPASIRKRAVVVDQAKLRLPIGNTRLRLELAGELLDQYRRRARLVITSKIHCAMPCIAMGIPVVFLYDAARRDDYRVKIIEDLVGIHYVHNSGPLAALRNLHLARGIDWNPPPLDIESLKLEIAAEFGRAFSRVHAGEPGVAEAESAT